MKLKSHAVGISNNFSVKASPCIANIRVGRRFLVGAVSSTASDHLQMGNAMAGQSCLQTHSTPETIVL